METILSLIGTDAVVRHIDYLRHYTDNIDALREQVVKLRDARDRVKGKIDDARRKGEIIQAGVESWISKLDDARADVEKFLKDEAEANKNGLGGWITRYRLGKEARKKTKLVISLLQEEGEFESVSRPAPPPGIIFSSMGIFEAFESRKLIMNGVMEALNDQNTSIIGICGMGGAGKTTLVTEIAKRVKDKLFEEVVMVTVSQNPSLTKIQEELATRLGLPLPANDESARASRLWERIKAQKQILVILDDAWRRIDLMKIGIPFGIHHQGCKILLTSRNKGVCDAMEAGKTFSVELLSGKESWLLFEEAAGPVVHNSDINPVARKVVAECGGLPLAILTVGRALRNKDKYTWETAALQLKKSTPTIIDGIQENLFSILKLSYNYLESGVAKSLFLFCCLFPEDHYIEIEVLVRYGMGLRWFENVDTVEEARLETHAVVSSLISSFLLIVGYSNSKRFVRMHDVVRDVAIAIASKVNNPFMVKAGIGLKVWPNQDSYEDLTAISLMRNDIREIPDGLNCLKLQVLLLQGNGSLAVISENFFRGMKDFKVLDLSWTKISSLPSSLSFLANLRTLLLKCCTLDDISFIGNLRSLEILSLCRSALKEIPLCFSQLHHLRILDLTGCHLLKLIPQGVISCLDKLEELGIGDFGNWDRENNAEVVELQALSRLTFLGIALPPHNYLPNLKHLENLKRFEILVGIQWEEVELLDFDLEYLRIMVLSLDMNDGPLLDWVKCLLKRSEYLCLSNMIGIEKVQDNLLVDEGFKELERLDLNYNKGIKYLLNTLEWAPHNITFNNLEVLKISGNPNFVEICHGQVVPTESFSKLQELEVTGCETILNIVPAHLLQRLQNFKKCHVRRCESLIHVFDLQGLEIVKEETKFLSSLQNIALEELPSMTHIWKGDIQSINLHSLRRIYIVGCNKLVNIFTTAIAKSLVLLNDLTVYNCSEMREIMTDEEGEKSTSTEKIMFPNLSYISIVGLDNITCFCSGQYPIEFPALETLLITNCPKMKTFGNGNQVTPKLKEVRLQYNYQWNGDLNNTVKQFYQLDMINKEEAMKTAENKEDQEISGSDAEASSRLKPT